MGRGSRKRPKRVRQAAARISVGNSVVLPIELAIFMVAKEFGVLPWTLYDEDAADVMTTYSMMVMLQPKPKGNKRV